VAESKWLRIEVADTCIGIDSFEQNFIFEPFKQVDSSSTRGSSGTGLGLSIVKKLVQAMQGSVHFTSQLGQGSTFVVELPLLSQAIPLEQAQGTSLKAMSDVQPVDDQGAKLLQNMQVLVAEDHPVNQTLIKILLQKLGCQVTLVGNGQQALDQIKNKQFDVVLMDCQMPVMDGYEATRQIRAWEACLAAGKKIPIVAVTAHAMAQDHPKCLEAGMTDYLSKPYTPKDLKLCLLRAKLTHPKDGSNRGKRFNQ